MDNASTQTGLRVFATILDKVYQTGKTATQAFKKNMPIHFDAILPKWNDVAKPTGHNNTV